MAATRHAMPDRLVTAEELLALDAESGDDELVEGVLCPVSPVNRRSSRSGMRIGSLLTLFVDEHDLGEVYGADAGFVLTRAPDTVRSPDVAFVRGERLTDDVESQERYLDLAPDLAVEVLSPSNRARELSDKVLEYLAAGTRLVWVIEPRQRIVTVDTPDRTARILREDELLDGSDVLPGFSLPVHALFG